MARNISQEAQMADLQKFHAELVAEHDKLTKIFLAAQAEAEAKWAVSEAAAAAVTVFRAKYGKVLKALNEGAVKVEG
jgi:hypothetical protein